MTSNPFQTTAKTPRERHTEGNRSLTGWRNAVAALLAALLALTAAGCGGPGQPATPSTAPPALGSRPLVDRTPDQFETDLKGLGGRVVVVNFWASWCGPCREELPTLAKVAKAYAGRPVTFIGVDASDERGDATAFLARSGATFPTVFDRKGIQGGIAGHWEVTGLPQTWFLAPDGSRAGRVVSPISEAELRRRIDDLLG
jgi:thiol-disulfide isomerase/thioredoxin